MKKTTAPSSSGYHQYHHAHAQSFVSYRSLIVVFITTLLISFVLAKIAYRMYSASVDRAMQQQRIQESQSMDELLLRFTK